MLCELVGCLEVGRVGGMLDGLEGCWVCWWDATLVDGILGRLMGFWVD